MNKYTVILLVVCMWVILMSHTIYAEDMGEDGEDVFNWIPVSEPFGLLSAEQGHWVLCSHNVWWWMEIKGYASGIKWYYYRYNVIAGCSSQKVYTALNSNHITKTEDIYFVLIFPHGNYLPKDLKAETFLSRGKWLDYLSELNFTIPAKWLYPDEVLKTETIYESKPWRFVIMKGILGLTDQAWFVLFWAITILFCIITGMLNKLLKINCRKLSFLSGVFIVIAGVFTLIHPSIYTPVSVAFVFLIFCPLSCYLAERIGESYVPYRWNTDILS